MAKIAQIATDATLETAGTWIPYLEDIELLVARSDNPEFKAWLRTALRPHRRRLAKIKEKEMRELTLDGWARYVLKGWKNLQDIDGTEIAYSPEKAAELLRRSDLKDLYDFVVKNSQDQSNFIQAVLDADLGN